MQRLTPKQCSKIIELRALEEPVTISNLSMRFGVSERTIYYILANYKAAERTLRVSMDMANGVN